MKRIYLLLCLLPSLILAGQVKVFYNARIFTANPSHPYAEAIAISGDTILSVGNLAEIKNTAGNSATWMDLKGGFLMPGFVDSHCHAISGGRGLTKANTADSFLTVEQLAAYARQELQRKEGMTGDVLVIYSLNISTWKWLDELIRTFNTGEFTTQPLVLLGSDGHTAWCNRVMMNRAGINRSFISTLGAEEKLYYGTDPGGEPNGFVSENGVQKVMASIPPETDYRQAAEKAMEYNNRYGITGWLDPSAGNIIRDNHDYLDAYGYLAESGKLTAHIAAAVVADANQDPKPQAEKIRIWQKKFNRKNFSILGFKIFADGVIEHPTHTAALSLPYTGTTSRGVLMFDPEKFSRFATEADKQNLLVHVHAIGDRAVTETLNGFEMVRRSNRNSYLPHTITHLQIVQPSDFERFTRLKILASFQLLWAFGDVTTVDIVKPYIDPSLYRWQYPARSMLQAGVTICGASDWPVSSGNPFEAIYNAETRKGPLGVLDSSECMPRLAMLYAYTSGAAKALMMDHKTGSLQTGRYADMILLDRDILTVSAESMKETRVLWTMFEGKVVYTAAGEK